MTYATWLKTLKGLAVDHARLDANSAADLRQALGQLVQHMSAAPLPIQTEYQKTREDTLARAAEQDRRALERGTTQWLVPGEAGPAQVALALGARVRALDAELYGKRDLGPVPDPNFEYRWGGEGSGFLVPRVEPLPAPEGTQRTKFRRRGLLYHRAFPAEVSGLEVRLFAISNSAGSALTGQFGAALFKALKLQTKSEGGLFVVTGVDCADHHEQISVHVESALGKGCDIALWPELTMPDDAVDSVLGRVLDIVSEADLSLRVPELFVLGSWHRERDGKRYNRSPVYNGAAELIFNYDKVKIFEDEKLGLEDISSGEMIPLILIGDSVVTMGICKDFCDRMDSDVLGSLDVDWVLVPSYGDDDTMEQHLVRARDLQIKVKGEALVVQQLDAGEGALGYVLFTPACDVKAAEPATLRTRASWSVYAASNWSDKAT